MNREEVFAWAKEKYGVEPEYLWDKYPKYAVLRHEDNEKWFAIIMDVDRDKLGLVGDGRIDVMDVKEDPGLIDEMVKHDGFFRAYHMNKEDWVSVALDGSVDSEKVESLLEKSYALTYGK